MTQFDLHSHLNWDNQIYDLFDSNITPYVRITSNHNYTVFIGISEERSLIVDRNDSFYWQN